MTNDFINACFDSGMVLLTCLSIKRITLDKGYAGLHLGSTVLFTTKRFWNLYYFASLDQWFSFWMSGALVVVTLVWLYLLLYYGRK